MGHCISYNHGWLKAPGYTATSDLRERRERCTGPDYGIGIVGKCLKLATSKGL